MPKEPGEPKFEAETTEPEKSSEYNFELLKELEQDVVSMVKQMKDGIEKGRWSGILSDDMGGRLPALVLRKILQEKGPIPAIKTYFLAAGKNYMPANFVDAEDAEEWSMRRRHNEVEDEPRVSDEEKNRYKTAKDYIEKLDFGTDFGASYDENYKEGRVLVVTEYTFKGKTLEKIGVMLDDINKFRFDFAILHTTGFSDVLDRLQMFKRSGSKVFIGKEDYGSHFAEDHKNLGGIKKADKYSPIPESVVGYAKKKGEKRTLFSLADYDKFIGYGEGTNPKKLPEWMTPEEKIEFEAKGNEWDKMMAEPLTSEDIRKAQEDINKARQDVDTMARRVIEQVWGE